MPDPTIRHASKANLITIVQGLKDLYTNQDAFAKIKVGATTTPATDQQDTFELVGGENVELSIAGKVVTITGDYDVATQIAAGLMSASDKTKLDGIEDEAQVNVIETVKVNGTTLAIASKAIDILIAEGATNGTVKANGVDVPVHGLDNAAYKDVETAVADDDKLPTGAAVKAFVEATLASVFKPAGSVTAATLPTLAAGILGNVYNVTDELTTTADFVEGAGNTYPAGTNVVVVDVDTTGESPEYKFDVLPGFVDLSGYVLRDEIGALTAAEVAEILAEA